MRSLFFATILLICAQKSLAKEGLFDPSKFSHLEAIDVKSVVESTVKIDMGFAYKVNLFINESDKFAWEKQTHFFATDGNYVTYKGFLNSDKERCKDKRFEIEPGHFEFCRHIAQGGSFPEVLPLVSAIGAGSFISKDGYILTAYHVAQSCIIDHQATHGKYDFKPLKCRSLKVYQAHSDASSTKITFQVVGDVWLVANSSFSETFPSPQHQELDLAILKVAVNPSHHLTPDDTFALGPSTQLYTLGFPIRTYRALERLKSVGYRDADSTLRFSIGTFLRQDGNYNYISDADVWKGNSGGPTINAAGKLVGIVDDCIGSQIDAAFAYKGCETQHVTIKSICRRLDMFKKIPSIQGCSGSSKK